MNRFGLENDETLASLTLRMTDTGEERDWWQQWLADNPELGGYPPPMDELGENWARESGQDRE